MFLNSFETYILKDYVIFSSIIINILRSVDLRTLNSITPQTMTLLKLCRLTSLNILLNDLELVYTLPAIEKHELKSYYIMHLQL